MFQCLPVCVPDLPSLLFHSWFLLLIFFSPNYGVYFTFSSFTYLVIFFYWTRDIVLLMSWVLLLLFLIADFCSLKSFCILFWDAVTLIKTRKNLFEAHFEALSEVNKEPRTFPWLSPYQKRRAVFFLLGFAVVTGPESTPFWSSNPI